MSKHYKLSQKKNFGSTSLLRLKASLGRQGGRDVPREAKFPIGFYSISAGHKPEEYTGILRS
jgi:hypothetical protein